MLPVVAIVGRPNVGKSTLFNRILGQRKAIVEDFAGVTRDLNYAEVTRYEKPFLLIDTGGFEPASTDQLLSQMREQSQLALEEADIVILLMDVRDGLTPSDIEVAQILRKIQKPVFFVANKVDGDKQEDAVAEFYALGVERVYSLSSAHGRGVGELIDDMLEMMPLVVLPDAEGEIRMAVIGRPNVGKSSLINRMLGFERVVANPTAGTTRDSVDTPFDYEGQRYVFIDTAGIRRKGKVSQTLEKYSVIQALKAMDRAHVVLMIIDAVEGVTDQDLAVAGYAYERGRALILAVNKWDLPEKDTHTMKRYLEEVRRRFKYLPFAPVLFISALTGQRVDKIMPCVSRVFGEFNRKITTSELNSVLGETVVRHPPPMSNGRRIKLFYATQTTVRPPTFTIFTNSPDDIHFSYERYLQNSLREAFGYEGVPIRLKFRGRDKK